MPQYLIQFMNKLSFIYYTFSVYNYIIYAWNANNWSNSTNSSNGKAMYVTFSYFKHMLPFKILYKIFFSCFCIKLLMLTKAAFV